MITINTSGQLQELTLPIEGSQKSYKVPLQQKEGQGPTFYHRTGSKSHTISLKKQSQYIYTKKYKQVLYSIEYKECESFVEIVCSIKNTGTTPFQPETCGIKLGIDSWMESFPSWNEKLFPTHMRCEKTHFTGYMMSPMGDILTIGVPEPVASWSLDYNNRGHRIRTVNIDLLNAPPLPSRHPTNCSSLQPQEERAWHIRLAATDSIKKVPALLAQLSEAPWIEMHTTTVKEHRSVHFSLHGTTHNKPIKKVLITPQGNQEELSDDCTHITPTAGVGLYKLQITVDKKITEASFSCRKNWSWYMDRAREEALRSNQLATTHCESLYGFYTLLRGEKISPNQKLWERTEERWNIVMPQVENFETYEPIIRPDRIQNIATHMNLFCDRFKVTKQEADLNFAIAIAKRFITGHQHPDGSYRNGSWGNPEKGVHYTSVIYPAMNLMELYDIMREEERAGRRPSDGTSEYIYTSIAKAMDELERNRDNIDTEGELTFEDGMISCSAAQLSRFALMQTDNKERERYTKAAESLLQKHRCLTQILTPDARQRGATLRYWEAQYDLITFPNMLNSPHGWTSWRSYALYYLYLLRGERDLLIQLMNVLGTCMQVVNTESGELRWGFIADPYVRAWELKKPTRTWDKDTYNKVPLCHQNPRKKQMEFRIIGEEYLSMNSSWQYGNPNDNDVHEHFRCLSEVALTQAFVIETEHGIESWNVTVEKRGDTLILNPEEGVVTRVHLNLLKEREVCTPNTSPEKIQQGWYNL